MNRELAINYLQSSGFSDEQIKAIEGAFTCDKCVYSTSEGCQYDDITETIPPFEDCIRRQAVLNAMYELCNTGETLKENPWRDNPHIDAVVEAIEELPSVTPQQRIGHSFPERATNKDIFKAIFGYEPATDSVVCNKEDWCGASEPCKYCTSNSNSIGREETWWNAEYKESKTEWEHDHEILKAYSDGASAVLDNVRAEIDGLLNDEDSNMYAHGVMDCLEIIDKFMAEGSEE